MSTEANSETPKDSAQAHLERARALASGGSFFEARVAFQQALASDLGSLEILSAYGSFLLGFGRFREALDCFEQILEREPENVAALKGAGQAWLELGQENEALRRLLVAQKLVPDDIETLRHLGRCLRALQHLQMAASCYRQALLLRPDDPALLNGLGSLLCTLNELDEAERLHNRALQLSPDNLDARIGLGNLALAREQVRDALRYYALSIEASPHEAGLQYNAALAHLLLGEFVPGWELYDSRLQRAKAWAEVDRKRWRGHPPSQAGQRLLLLAEQGLGDTIQFVRFAPQVAALGYRVSLLVHDCQKHLFLGQCGLEEVFGYSDPVPLFDEYCPILSLPRLLGCTDENSFGKLPYLKAPGERLPKMKALLGDWQKPRIGIVWAGNHTHQNDYNRSLALSQLLAHLPAGLPTLIGLQKEPRPKDLELLAKEQRVRNFGEQLGDFADTAALLGQLDLLIAVDTSTAHLAGALGLPVWLLLPTSPDWRWQLGREDSPWYAKTRLFRQKDPGHWEPVLQKLSEELAAFLAASR